MTVQQVAGKNPDGSNIGYATSDKVALYGVTPVAQQSLTVASAAVGSASSADVTTDLKAAVVSMMTAGEALGLWNLP